jgi:hypothetical protein
MNSDDQNDFQQQLRAMRPLPLSDEARARLLRAIDDAPHQPRHRRWHAAAACAAALLFLAAGLGTLSLSDRNPRPTAHANVNPEPLQTLALLTSLCSEDGRLERYLDQHPWHVPLYTPKQSDLETLP